MATGKITMAALGKLEGWLWDDRVIGFGARKQRRGVFYYLRYRDKSGTQRMYSIGRHGSPWTPDAARAKALEWLGSLASGTDPFAQSLTSETFGAEIERYLERKRTALKPRSFVETGRYLRTYAKPLHKLTLGEIDRKSVAVLLGQVETNSGAITRNRMRAALSTFFAWAITEGLIETNPVQGTAKADEGNGRERVLAQDELRALCAALGDGNFADIVRLLLLTGARRSEIGMLRWPEVDLAKRQIILPAHRVKNGREHCIPLSTQALAIVARQPRRNSTEFVFSDRGFQDWDRCKQVLDQRVGIAAWRIHDLRRTCATCMGDLGVLPHVIEQTLNHVSGAKAGVAGVYNRSKMTDAVREGLQNWADHIDQIIKS